MSNLAAGPNAAILLSKDAVMPKGRRPSGPRLIAGLDGSLAAKERATAILETLAGKITILDAARRIGVSEAHFHRLRDEFLAAGLSSLEPRPLGRPPKPPGDDLVEKLAQENQRLTIERDVARVREEIARTVPRASQQKKQDDEPG